MRQKLVAFVLLLSVASGLSACESPEIVNKATAFIKNTFADKSQSEESSVETEELETEKTLTGYFLKDHSFDMMITADGTPVILVADHEEDYSTGDPISITYSDIMYSYPLTAYVETDEQLELIDNYSKSDFDNYLVDLSEFGYKPDDKYSLSSNLELIDRSIYRDSAIFATDEQLLIYININLPDDVYTRGCVTKNGKTTIWFSQNAKYYEDEINAILKTIRRNTVAKWRDYSDITDETIYEFPFEGGTDTIELIGDTADQIQYMQIPDYMLKNMGTEKLLVTSLYYPFIDEMFEEKNNHYSTEFNGINELAKRDDFDAVSDKIASILNVNSSKYSTEINRLAEIRTYVDGLIAEKNMVETTTEPESLSELDQMIKEIEQEKGQN